MSEKCKCACAFPWLSGFFGAPALIHLIRATAGWDISFKGEPIDLKVSWITFGVTTFLSILFGVIGCKLYHKGDSGSASSCCK